MVSAFALLGLLFIVPVLVSMWIGVLALRKSGKRVGPRLMLGGCIALSAGLVGLVLVGIAALADMELVTGFMLIAQLLNILIPLGILVFMIGFTLHGLQVRRVYERIGELESIIEAQQQQLSHYEAKA